MIRLSPPLSTFQVYVLEKESGGFIPFIWGHPVKTFENGDFGYDNINKARISILKSANLRKIFGVLCDVSLR